MLSVVNTNDFVVEFYSMLIFAYFYLAVIVGYTFIPANYRINNSSSTNLYIFTLGG